MRFKCTVVGAGVRNASDILRHKSGLRRLFCCHRPKNNGKPGGWAGLSYALHGRGRVWIRLQNTAVGLSISKVSCQPTPSALHPPLLVRPSLRSAGYFSLKHSIYATAQRQARAAAGKRSKCTSTCAFAERENERHATCRKFQCGTNGWTGKSCDGGRGRSVYARSPRS